MLQGDYREATAYIIGVKHYVDYVLEQERPDLIDNRSEEHKTLALEKLKLFLLWADYPEDEINALLIELREKILK